MRDEQQIQARFNIYAQLNAAANQTNLNLFSAENGSKGEGREVSEEDLAAAQAAAAANELRLLQFLQEGKR